MRRPVRVQAAINVTPYIDILLVLLIIFMVITPRTEYRMDAKSTTSKAGSAAILVLSVDADARLTLNSQPVSYSALGEELFQVLSERADRTIFLRGDANLPFGTIAHVIDIAKGAGAADVALTVG